MLRALVLLAAGVLAGVVGTAGAITSLVSYPALLAVGVAPLSASIANIVALSTAWPGSALASRPELAGHGRWLVRHGPVAAAGGALGAGLLLSTPAGAFARIVPFLLAAGALALLLSPRLTERRPGRPRASAWLLVPAMFLIALYGGYFGAGSGVMLLVLCLAVLDARLPVANAAKNMLVGANNLASAVVLVILAPVHWAVVVPLGLGVLVGGALGPSLTRRLPPALLRRLVAAVGFGLAIQLWLTHGA